jgi:hypothetical protein
VIALDVDLSQLVSRLSISEKAVLVILCGVPSISENLPKEMEPEFKRLKGSHPTLFTEVRGALILTPLGGAYAGEANRQLLQHYPAMTLPSAYDDDEDFRESLDAMLAQRQSLGFDIDQECDEVTLPRVSRILGQKLDMTKEELLLERAACYKDMLLQAKGMTSERFVAPSNGKVDGYGGLRKPLGRRKSTIAQTFLGTENDVSLASMSFKPDALVYSYGPDKLPDEVARLLQLKALPVATQRRFQTLFAKQDTKGFVLETAYGALLKYLVPGRTSESQIMFDKQGNIINVYGIGDAESQCENLSFT